MSLKAASIDLISASAEMSAFSETSKDSYLFSAKRVLWEFLVVLVIH